MPWPDAASASGLTDGYGSTSEGHAVLRSEFPLLAGAMVDPSRHTRGARGSQCGALLLLGALHDQDDVAQQVQEAIEDLRPDHVGLELCERRFGRMFPMGLEHFGEMTTEERRRFLAQLRSGKDQLSAALAAHRLGVPVALCDRDVRITEDRLLKHLEVPMLRAGALGALGWPSWSDPIEVEEALEEAVASCIWNERDLVMASRLRSLVSGGRLVVAVLGPRHLPGIARCWAHEVDPARVEAYCQPVQLPLWRRILGRPIIWRLRGWGKDERSSGRESVSSAPFAACRVPATRAHLSKDSLRIDMEIQFPKKEKKKAKAWSAAKRNTGSMLSHIFTEQKYPEPVYFQSVDCVGIPHFLWSQECRKIIDFAEAQGFSRQNRHRDLIDPFLVEALWQVCGLGWFLRKLTIDGEVPCGLNDVVRIQKFGPGGVFGKHTDQPVRRADGRNSKYSLRIFLNGKEDEAFEGGLSAFHVAFRPKPVVFEPEAGLALIYPQGEFCQVQEELEVLAGNKYVLRADILFQRADELVSPHVPFHHPSPSTGEVM
eukprot:g15474.t3